MRTFDRAMYAICLLVILADVARAQSSMPMEIEASSGFILGAVSHAQGSPAVGTLRALLAGGDEVRSSSVARSFGDGILGLYRSTAARYRLAYGGSKRNNPESTFFAIGSEVARLPVEDVSAPLTVRWARLSPVRVVFEHSGSPAP